MTRDQIMAALKRVRYALATAHRNADWEKAKLLSQKKCKLRRRLRPTCADCGVIISGGERCMMHSNVHQFYDKRLPA